MVGNSSPCWAFSLCFGEVGDNVLQMFSNLDLCYCV